MVLSGLYLESIYAFKNRDFKDVIEEVEGKKPSDEHGCAIW